MCSSDRMYGAAADSSRKKLRSTASPMPAAVASCRKAPSRPPARWAKMGVFMGSHMTQPASPGARFRAADPTKATPAAATLVRAGAVEKSNVSMVERIAEIKDFDRQLTGGDK